jgi:hypothetical protein
MIVLVAGPLLVAAVAKAFTISRFTDSFVAMGLRRRIAGRLARVIMISELAAVVMLIVGSEAPVARLPLLVLFSSFAVVGGFAHLSGRRVECGCVGSLAKLRLGWPQVLQFPVAAAALWATTIDPPEWSIWESTAVLSALLLTAAVALLASASGSWFKVRSQRTSLHMSRRWAVPPDSSMSVGAQMDQ